MHPNNIERLGAEDGAPVLLYLNGVEIRAIVNQDETLSPGVVLVPRSMDIPINKPTSVEIKVAEHVDA
jgi:hypothetical protein